MLLIYGIFRCVWDFKLGVLRMIMLYFKMVMGKFENVLKLVLLLNIFIIIIL